MKLKSEPLNMFKYRDECLTYLNETIKLLDLMSNHKIKPDEQAQKAAEDFLKSDCRKKIDRQAEAYKELLLITKAVNDCIETPEENNSAREPKWFPLFRRDTMKGTFYCTEVQLMAGLAIPPGLAFINKKSAVYAGQKYWRIYLDYFNF